MRLRHIFTLLVAALLVACAQTVATSAVLAKGAQQAIVVTANKHATKAGADILRAGGSAVDAAIAIEAVLSLVEPQSSGLAGGAFMTYYDASTKQVMIYDGRETAPAGAKADMFLQADGKRMGYLNAKHSGLSTGVPGVISMFDLAHKDYGKLPWGEHFDHAKKLAAEGFEISPRMQSFMVRFKRFIPKTKAEGPTDAHQYFYDQDGEPYPVGHVLKNPAYAKTLEIIASSPAAFYQGEIAQQIVDQVSRSPRAGSMTLADIQGYSATRREALCSPYQELLLCGPPPPSSWVAVAMTMGLLENAPAFSKAGASDPLNWGLFAQAQRLAYADRDHYVADPAYASIPLQGMLDKAYLKSRAKLIRPEKAAPTVNQGNPWDYQKDEQKVAGVDATHDVAGTTHFVVVDMAGNVVSLTASVESVFGSSRMAGGMFLNNQLTDFSFQAVDQQGLAIANAVAANKRPRSSMSPTIVLDANGDFKIATGSPGGNSIIAYTAKTLVAMIDWGLSPQQAIDLPNLVARGDKVRIEQERASPELVQGLRDFGFALKESAGENSGLHVVERGPDGALIGGVDPRREGLIEIVSP